MGEGFGQWFFFMYLCIQEKRAVSLSIVRQNGSHKSVKKLLHFCYTTTWTNQLGSCYTTKYERVVHFPLSPQTAVAHWAMAIFFIMIGTWSFVSILYFEIREAFYISLLATSWLHSSQKKRFFTNTGLGNREISLPVVFLVFDLYLCWSAFQWT